MGDNDLAVIDETYTRLRKFLLSVSDLSGGEQEDAGWSEFGTGEVPMLGLAFPSIISDSEASWGAPPPLTAKPCLEDGSEGIPPRTRSVLRPASFIHHYARYWNHQIRVNRDYIALQSCGDLCRISFRSI